MKTIGQIACEAWWSRLHQVSRVDFAGWEYTTPTDKSLWEAAAQAVMDHCHGDDLRDRFAMAALASLSSSPDYSTGPCSSAMADRVYCIAEAMLKAREE